MPVSLSTVRATQPDKLVDAAEELGRTRAELQTIIAGEREMLAALQADWSGQAASRALTAGLKNVAGKERVARRLVNLESALRSAGLQMGALRSAVLDLVGAIDAFGFRVADDGTVTAQQWLIGRFLDSLAQKFTTALRWMLQVFTDLDENTASAIDQATGPDVATETVTVDGGPVQIPSQDGDPADVAAWWNALSDRQRQELIAAHPPILGNLNGIPAEARDRVNVAVMDDDLDRVEGAAQRNHVTVDDVTADPGRYGLSATDVTRYENAQRTQQGLLHQLGSPDGEAGRYSQISEQERHDKAYRPTMLWAYDPLAFGGKGRAAVAIGDPDHASNTAVIVPGTSASVRGGWLADGHNDAVNLYSQSVKADPDHPAAVISWMGYDTPESFTDPNVGTPGLARAGGDALAWDVNSLSVTHDPAAASHVTVIGHSYGSTTVADAFADSGMRADDAVLLGCPGTDVARSAADFHLAGGHVYVGDASTDPVGWIGEAGPGLPNELNDRLGHLIGPSAGLGSDPAHEDFGATRFRAEVPGAGGLDPKDHSSYYTPGSEALRSMTEIATGHADRLAGEDLLALPRTEVTVSTPDGVDVPFVGKVPLPHVDIDTPVVIDPESDRPGDSVTDDHGYR